MCLKSLIIYPPNCFTKRAIFGVGLMLFQEENSGLSTQYVTKLLELNILNISKKSKYIGKYRK
jgi:hypothetical protein